VPSAILWTDVTNIAPAMSGVAAGAQVAILAFVNETLSQDEWGTGERYRMGGALLAAHFGSLVIANSATGPAGPVTSMSLGDASKSWAAPSFSTTDADLERTTYGAGFLGLVRTLPCAFGLLL
jgi:hypothetical protein